VAEELFSQPIVLNFSQSLIDYWWSFPIGILLFLLIYFFTHPDKIAIWSSMISGWFETLSKKSAKHSVSTDIQSRISSYIKSNKANDILPYGLKFKWLKGENFSSYVEGEDVVIIMDYHHNNARNFINAINEYTAQAFLPKVRHEIPQTILTAAELVLQERIIQEKRPDALEMFRSEVLPTKTSNNEEMKKMLERFKLLDKLGYFDNIFLSEVVFAGGRLQGLENNQKKNDFEGLIGLLEGMDDETKPLEYQGNVFKVDIILVAKQFKKFFQGTHPYLKRAEDAASKNFDSLYVLGREPNKSFVDEVITRIKEKNIGRLAVVRDYKTRDKKRRRKNAKMALFRL